MEVTSFENRPTNTKAIISLLLGIMGILLFNLLGIAAIVLGVMANKEIEQTMEKGGGMAMAGIILGVLSLVWMVIAMIFLATFMSAFL